MSSVSKSASTPSLSWKLLAVLGSIALYLTYNFFTDSDITPAGVDTSLSETPITRNSRAMLLTPELAATGDLTQNATKNLTAETASEIRAATESQPTGAAADDSTGENESPSPRELSSRVMRVIEEVQSRQLDGQWEEALNEMNALYADFDSLNPFEQVTLLNFYTNTLIRLQMWEESISAFSRVLTIPELRPDLNARALLALGQLHSRIGDKQQALNFYHEWLAFTEGKQGYEQQTPRVLLQLEELKTK